MTTSRGVFLLDSNVLIAWATPSHPLHVRVNEWMTRQKPIVATCPITQGALIRVAMKSGGLSFLEAQRVLDSIVKLKNHRFLADSIPYSSVGGHGLLGHNQVTDAYLARLAQESGLRLASLDRAQVALHPGVAEWIG